MEFISEYDNKVVDTLIKRVLEMYATTISIYKTYLKTKILEVVKLDHLYLQNKENIQQSNIQQKYKDDQLKGDDIVLYRKKVYVPNFMKLRNLVL